MADVYTPNRLRTDGPRRPDKALLFFLAYLAFLSLLAFWLYSLHA